VKAMYRRGNILARNILKQLRLAISFFGRSERVFLMTFDANIVS
jgi:hypothetical protein